MDSVKKNQPTQQQLDYIKNSYETPDESEKNMPWYRSIPSAVGQAVGHGTLNILKGLSDAPTPFVPNQEIMDENGDTTILNPGIDINEEGHKFLDKKLPIGDAFLPRMIKRAGQNIVEGALLGPEAPLATLGRTAVGGALAEGAKDMGAPEWVQGGLEIGTQFTPDFSRAIPNRLWGQAARTERQLISDAERFNMTPDEYALTLNQRGPIKDFVQDVAAKGGRVVDRFENTRQALSRVWDTLRNSPEAQTVIPRSALNTFVTDMNQQLQHLPAEQRARVMQDLSDFAMSPRRGEDLINLWQDLNYYIHNHGERGLGTLKPMIQTALESVSPSLAHDFQITNTLYGNFHRLAERMGPNVAHTLINAGENGIVLTAISTGNYPLLTKVLKPLAARQLAAEMSTNPRLMNLSSRLISAIERGLPIVAKKVYDNIVSEVGKTNAEASLALSGLDLDKIIESLPKESEEKKK